MKHSRHLALLALFTAAAAGCGDSGTNPDGDRIFVSGIVRDAQSNTRLLFYDEDLNQLGPLSIQVRQDGTYGPLTFGRGTFFGAGTASGFTTGEFESFTLSASDSARTVDFDLDPITVALAVGNRWTYDEQVFAPVPGTFTVVVEITTQQPGQGVPAVFRVEERRTDPNTGGAGETSSYFLAQDASGIRKSADAVIDGTDELLLRLPATLGSSWSTVDFATGAPLQKRIRALSCDASGCVETTDFTIAQEPAGTFMSVSVLYTLGSQAFVTVFSDIGIVDGFAQSTANGQLLSQRKLRSFTSTSLAASREAGIR